MTFLWLPMRVMTKRSQYRSFHALLIFVVLLGVIAWLRSKSSSQNAVISPHSPSKGESNSQQVITREKTDVVDRAALPSLPEAHVVFESVLRQFSLARQSQRDDGENSRFEREELFHIRGLRLFALVYPEAAEKEACAVALDTARPATDRSGSMEILKVLGEKKSEACIRTLSEIASRKEDPLKNIALFHLAAVDEPGRYKDLYRSRAREGAIEAVVALSRWADPMSIPCLQETYERGVGRPFPDGSTSGSAKCALQQIALLDSPVLAKEVQDIIGGRNRERGNWEWQEWALSTATRRNLLPEIVSTLIERLATDDSRALDSGAPGVDSRSAYYAHLTGDPYYDDLLLAVSATGGTLSEAQRNRLYAFGYLGNPADHLRQVLAGK
jgi:hypothetical protein